MKITKESKLGDIIQKHPEAVESMMRAGLHCVGCHAAAFETIGEGAKAHGMSDDAIEKLLKEMNEAVKEK